MTSSATPLGGRETAVLLARAGWMAVSEDLLAGLCHDLSNRAASLEGLAHLLPEGSADVLGQVGPEIKRLGGTVGDLRALLGNLGSEPEPLLVSDVLAQTRILHRIRRDLEAVAVDYEVAEGLQPVLANPTCLVRILLVILGETVSAALDAGGGRVLVGASGTTEEVCVFVDSETEAERYLETETADALRALIGPAGWALAEDPGSVRLSMPSLARARAMEG